LISEISLISAGLGALVGCILALTGAGGAILAIPLLVFSLGLNLQQAAPIALLAIFTAASIGTLQGLSQGLVRYKTALLIALLGIICAPLGVMLAHWLPLPLLSGLFAGILISVALRSWQYAKFEQIDNKDTPPPACTINPTTSRLFWTARCTWRLLSTGALAGLLSGLLGVGGGFVIVPSLQRASNFKPQVIVATTLAAIAIITASSLALHGVKSTIHWQIALPFTFSATIVMLALGTFSEKTPNAIRQKGFAILCIVAAFYLAANAVIL
jgi:hypothetical protein